MKPPSPRAWNAVILKHLNNQTLRSAKALFFYSIMGFNLISNIESCSTFAIPHLLYFSHIPTAIIALLLGFFVYFKNRNGNSFVGKLLLFTAASFFLWSISDIILWKSVDSRITMFVWSIINLVEMLVSSSTLYFSYVFFEKKEKSSLFCFLSKIKRKRKKRGMIKNNLPG